MVSFVEFIRLKRHTFQEIVYAWDALQSMCNEIAMLAFKEKGFSALLRRSFGEDVFKEDTDGRLIYIPTGTKFIIKTNGSDRNLFQVSTGTECDFTSPHVFSVHNYRGKKTASTPEEAKELVLSSSGCDYVLLVNLRQIGLVDLNTIPASRFDHEPDDHISLTVGNNDLVPGCSVTFNFTHLPRVDHVTGVDLVLEVLAAFADEEVKSTPMEDDVEITYPEKVPDDLQELKKAHRHPARLKMCGILRKHNCFWEGPTEREWHESKEKQIEKFKRYFRPGRKTQEILDSVEKLLNDH